jgi:molecular chaperone DnaK
VEIRVLQGEREMAGDNREIGRFILDGIPAAPRGVPQIEVTFDIDANGILSVSARDKATSREQSIRIEGTGGLNEGEIERMVKDAEAHAAEDRTRREKIEKKNRLDTMIYQAEKTLGESADKLEADSKKKLEDVLAEAKKDLESDDVARLDAATQRVESSLHEVAQALYRTEAQAGGGAEAASGAGEGGKPDEEVIDAEYTEEDKGDS